MTYALDYAIHRDAVDGSGGGITSTGRSEIAQGWVNDLIRLFDSGQSDEAIGKVFVMKCMLLRLTGNLRKMISQA